MGKARGSRVLVVRALLGAFWAECCGAVLRAASNALVLPAPGTNANAGLEDIRGIKDPVPIPGVPAWLWWLLAFALAAALGWWAWRKWGRKSPAAKPGVVIPPHRRAKDRLRSAGDLLSDPYRFCSLVSDVVRVYLEERFDLHAPERTTEEFLEEMRGSALLLPAQKAMLEQFLTRCDMVKFAREEPSENELKELLDSALRLIDETAPMGEAGADAQPIAEVRA